MSLNETAHPYTMEALRAKKGYIIDMDGVIYHGNMLLPGVERFVDFLKKNDKRFLFLTNSSERAPRELQQKLARLGLDVPWKPRPRSTRRSQRSLEARGRVKQRGLI